MPVGEWRPCIEQGGNVIKEATLPIVELGALGIGERCNVGLSRNSKGFSGRMWVSNDVSRSANDYDFFWISRK